MATPNSSSAISIDDLASVNAFLARIGGHQIAENQYHSASNTQPKSLASSGDDGGSASKQDSESDHHMNTPALTSNVSSLAASPVPGSRAPPPTPASRAVHPQHASQLEPVPEDGTAILVTLAVNSKHTLLDSKFAVLPKGRNGLAAENPKASNGIQRIPGPESQKELVEKMKDVNLHDNILQTFRQTNASLAEKPALEVASDAEIGTGLSKSMAKLQGNTVSDDEEIGGKSTDTEPFPPFKELTDPENSHPVPTKPVGAVDAIQKIKDLLAREAFQSKAVDESHKQGPSKAAEVGGNNPPIVVAKAGWSPQEEEEDREHLTHFETCGESAPRSARKARPRKVILTGLPMTADNTLVASLIHGGTIETFKLHPAFELSATKTATVLFADADAAQKYYDTYLNGLDFKHGGRKYVTFVEMGKEVDVLGSLMRGQLEAGASRVVRATGADEDWGMGALLKLAQGKGRKVEGIADYWRDGVRTIVFRFTNIPDAVQFRGQLIRDYEWEMCNIQFVDDPCQKATGVHEES